MPPAKPVSPFEALRLATRHRPRWRPWRLPLLEAGGLCLAEEITVPAPTAEPRRALVDGYAFTRLPAPGDEVAVSAVDPTLVDAGSATAAVRRVESGSALADDVVAVLPVACATIVGIDVVRIDRGCELGHGILEPGRSPRTRRIAAGERLTPRLQASLAAGGVEWVSVVPRPRVAYLAVGDDLCDPGSQGATTVHDVTSSWIAGALAAAGCEGVPLGSVGDDPEGICDVFAGLRSRRVACAILCGGLGDGISDRTVLALQRLECRISFERVALDAVPFALHGRALGIEVHGLSGVPLAAAAAFDLWVEPALAWLQGAKREAWDWRLRPQRLGDGTTAAAGDGWRLFHAGESSRAAGSAPERRCVRPGSIRLAPLGADPRSPWSESGDGWALLAPGGSLPGPVHCIPSLWSR